MIEDFPVSPGLIFALGLLSLRGIVLSGALSRLSSSALGLLGTLGLGDLIIGAHLALRGRCDVVREGHIQVESQDNVFAGHIDVKD